MKLNRVEKKIADGKVRLTAFIDSDTKGKNLEIWFEYDEQWSDFVVDHADPFVPLLMIPCGVYGEKLEIIPPVSQKIVNELESLQSIYDSWFDQYNTIEIKIDHTVERAPVNNKAAASFFSAGTDSFYTLLKNIKSDNPRYPAVSHIIMMNGYENPLEIDTTGKAKRELLDNVAMQYNLQPIYGASNFRTHFDVDWGFLYHGAGLSAGALSLSAGINTVYIASSFAWKDLFPWGSHPLLDPKWSNENINLVHHGCEARRVDKIEYCVNTDPGHLKYLHVCLSKREDSMNCGRCYKCVRTLSTIAAMGKMEEAVNFKHKFYNKYKIKNTKKILKKRYPLMYGERIVNLESYELSEKYGHPHQQTKEYLEYLLKKTGRAVFIHNLMEIFKSSKKL